MAVEGAGEDVEAVLAPGAGRDGAEERQALRLGVAGEGHPEGFETAPAFAVPPFVEQVTPRPSDEDVEASCPAATHRCG